MSWHPFSAAHRQTFRLERHSCLARVGEVMKLRCDGARYEDFSPLTVADYVSPLVAIESIQAFNGGLSRSMLSMGTAPSVIAAQ
jgi:hypothetical protein